MELTDHWFHEEYGMKELRSYMCRSSSGTCKNGFDNESSQDVKGLHCIPTHRVT
jgi:hypothetical protein